MSKNKLTKLSELMVITMEECGELIQACSKAIRCNDYHNDSLKEEIGDVMCMIELIKSNGLITQREIDNQIQTNRMKLMELLLLLNDHKYTGLGDNR